MPAKSAKQERFMQAVAHNPKFAKKAGVPQSVGREFTKSRAEGGVMKAKKLPPFMGKESKSEEDKEKKLPKGLYRRGERAEGEKMPKYAEGGAIPAKKQMSDDERAAKYRREASDPGTPSPAAQRDMRQQIEDAKQRKAAESAPTTKTGMGKLFARGGGVETQGKTKGKIVKGVKPKRYALGGAIEGGGGSGFGVGYPSDPYSSDDFSKVAPANTGTAQAPVPQSGALGAFSSMVRGIGSGSPLPTASPISQALRAAANSANSPSPAPAASGLRDILNAPSPAPAAPASPGAAARFRRAPHGSAWGRGRGMAEGGKDGPRFAKGGAVGSSRGDGIAKRGKTKGRMV